MDDEESYCNVRDDSWVAPVEAASITMVVDVHNDVHGSTGSHEHMHQVKHGSDDGDDDRSRGGDEKRAPSCCYAQEVGVSAPDDASDAPSQCYCRESLTIMAAAVTHDTFRDTEVVVFGRGSDAPSCCYLRCIAEVGTRAGGGVAGADADVFGGVLAAVKVGVVGLWTRAGVAL